MIMASNERQSTQWVMINNDLEDKNRAEQRCSNIPIRRRKFEIAARSEQWGPGGLIFHADMDSELYDVIRQHGLMFRFSPLNLVWYLASAGLLLLSSIYTPDEPR
jgi:hypothetical protein